MNRLDKCAVAVIALVAAFLFYVGLWPLVRPYPNWRGNEMMCNGHVIGHIEMGSPNGETSLPYWTAYNDIDGSYGLYFDETDAKRALNGVCKP
ncbi:MAG: hypothetical protein WB870_06660 [Gallionellaceae bacterium]